jgi:hypothetical protein
MTSHSLAVSNRFLYSRFRPLLFENTASMDSYALPREYQRLEHHPAYTASWGHLRSVTGVDMTSSRYSQPTWSRGLPPPNASSGPAAFLDVEDPRMAYSALASAAGHAASQPAGAERGSSVTASSVDHSRELPPALGSLQQGQFQQAPVAIGSRRKQSAPHIEAEVVVKQQQPQIPTMAPLGPQEMSVGIGALKVRPQLSRTPSHTSVESMSIPYRHEPAHQAEVAQPVRRSPEPRAFHRATSSRNASTEGSRASTPSPRYSTQLEAADACGNRALAVSTSPESLPRTPHASDLKPFVRDSTPTPTLSEHQQSAPPHDTKLQLATQSANTVGDAHHTSREESSMSPRRTPNRPSPRSTRRTPVSLIDRKRDEQRAELLTGTLREATHRIAFLNKTFREVAEAHRMLHDKEISLRSEVAAAEVDALATFDQCEDIKQELQRSVETLSEQLRLKRERLEKLRRNNERLKRELGTADD